MKLLQDIPLKCLNELSSKNIPLQCLGSFDLIGKK